MSSGLRPSKQTSKPLDSSSIIDVELTPVKTTTGMTTATVARDSKGLRYLSDSRAAGDAFKAAGSYKLENTTVSITTDQDIYVNATEEIVEQKYIKNGAGDAGVVTLNNLAGVVNLIDGQNIAIAKFGNNIQITSDHEHTANVREPVNIITHASGTQSLDISLNSIFVFNNISANFEINLVNMNLTASKATNIVLILNQDSVGYIPTAVKIDGVTQYIKWLGKIVPTPSTLSSDVLALSIVNINSTYSVFASLTQYG